MKEPGSQPLENAAWEKFCHLVAGGETAYSAYSKCYPNSSPANAETSGPKLMRGTQCRLRVEYLRGKTAEKIVKRTVLDRQRKLEISYAIAENYMEDPNAAIKAMEYDSKLTGDAAPEQVVVTHVAPDQAAEVLAGLLAGLMKEEP